MLYRTNQCRRGVFAIVDKPARDVEPGQAIGVLHRNDKGINKGASGALIYKIGNVVICFSFFNSYTFLGTNKCAVLIMP